LIVKARKIKSNFLYRGIEKGKKGIPCGTNKKSKNPTI